MIYVEAPKRWVDEDDYAQRPSLFLAGGITGCRNWQQQLVAKLRERDLVIFNPRRANFPMDDPKAAAEQILWEHEHLSYAMGISFWFSSETVQPITLYELGRWIDDKYPIFVGVDPNYPRRQDLEIQIPLVIPDFKIVYSLDDLAAEIHKWVDVEEEWRELSGN